MKNTTTRTLILGAAALLALSGCSAAAPEATPAASHSAASAADSVTVHDGWIKAVDGGMSGAFGDLRNAGESDIILVGATTPAASMVELHETVDNGSGAMVMREKDGGFTIPRGGEFKLAPGANHIMLMGLTGPLSPGETVSLTLTFSDDSTQTIDLPVKDYAGANENYEGDTDHTESSETPAPSHAH
ncbi:copper chaperone PCu(A)C [Mycetocola spongiae]|uniref:copper chaperone PCu(A)C n=1 Tax=Mycetocola spongiae TaxID=2859226 RepID=UPI001CF23581|nr:copper chaperone PCu(A)C [Mycetocola spongiae]UCR87945.1 copper chaperone PCu(A)C [Mycetocola spongiae]